MIMRRSGFTLAGVAALLMIIVMTGCGRHTTSAAAPTSTPGFLPVRPTVGTATPIKRTPTVTGSHEVQITMTDTQIQASTTTFQETIPYTFIVTNKARTAQNFIIKQRITQDRPATRVVYIIPSDQLSSGSTIGFTYTFPSGASTTNLEFTNYQQGPAGRGVAVPIQVKR